MVLVDLVDVDTGEPVEVSPRRILQRQVEAAADAGYVPMVGSEIEFFLFKESYDDAHADGYRDLTPNSPYLEDYHILQTTKDEYMLGAIRRGLAGAGVPVEFSKGEAGRGQHEINLTTNGASRWPTSTWSSRRGEGDRPRRAGKSATFMAKPHFDDAGSCCHIHSSLWDADGATSLMAGRRRAPHERAVPLVPRRADGDRRASSPAVRADGQQLQALPARQLGADRHRLGVDNRTLGFRMVGHGQGDARREPHPRRRRQQLLRLRGHDRRRAVRHRQPHRAAARRTTATATRPTDLAAHPVDLRRGDRAVARQRRSPRECFGDDVHHHVLHYRRGRVAGVQPTVTDWERRRYFERI